MRAVLPAAQAQREARGAILEVPMLWIEGRDRDAGTYHGIGLWSGEAVEDIWVTDLFSGNAVRRTFYNQGVLELGSVRNEVGLGVKVVSIALSSINVAVEVAFREYDPRGAKVQLWHRCYDPETRQAYGTEPYFAGYINEAPITRPVPGGEGRIEAEVVSTARMLTVSSALKKSHEAYKRRSGDMIGQYKVAAGRKDVAWGQRDE